MYWIADFTWCFTDSNNIPILLYLEKSTLLDHPVLKLVGLSDCHYFLKGREVTLTYLSLLFSKPCQND